MQLQQNNEFYRYGTTSNMQLVDLHQLSIIDRGKKQKPT